MKNFKRVTALLLVLCMCFSFTAFASAEENQLSWSFDESDGCLTISGTGEIPTLTSAEQQPWAAIREQITEVHVDPNAQYFADNIAYWFSGCTNLVYAEVPGFWLTVGQDAFKDCINLQELVFMTSGQPTISEDAFTCDNPADLVVLVNGELALNTVSGVNWHGRNVEFEDVSSIMTLPKVPGGHCMNGCYCNDCTWSYAYRQRDETYHYVYPKCDNCSANEQAYGSKEAHSFDSSGRCRLCGYYGGGSSGGGGGTSCSHSRTYTRWNGCNWYQYCYYCDVLLDSGVRHGTTQYDPWEYYSVNQHRRYGRCPDCGAGSYDYGYHSTQRKYSTYSATQHSYRDYCNICSSYIGSVSYEEHAFSYGSWSNYSSTQHRRSKTCSDCGYSTYEYGNHTDNNHDGKCDTCGFGMKVFSITVPISLPLIMDQNGEIHTSPAKIINDSTNAVSVTNLSVQGVNGWSLVPYQTDMAHEKVDSKHIGFRINGTETKSRGWDETLTLTGNWNVPYQGSLNLSYDASVSAISQAAKGEDVLRLVFVFRME